MLQIEQIGVARIILFNKPFGVLSQFTDPEGDRETLAHYLDLPGFRPAGRLDYDSEGLLILTDSGVLQSKIADPRHKMAKNYWVQVEGEPEETDLDRLRAGVLLKDGSTLPAQVERMIEPLGLWDRNPPIRYRASIPTAWLSLTIREGRNRQVRRMTAAIGYPTLRLVRAQIGDWALEALRPGGFRESKIPEHITGSPHRRNAPPPSSRTRSRSRRPA
jgi:23S rRNA pseudouridine2457 synthase